jgi:hypothetical protein
LSLALVGTKVVAPFETLKIWRRFDRTTETDVIAKYQWRPIELPIQCQIVIEGGKLFINSLVGHFSLAAALWVMG